MSEKENKIISWKNPSTRSLEEALQRLETKTPVSPSENPFPTPFPLKGEEEQTNETREKKPLYETSFKDASDFSEKTNPMSSEDLLHTIELFEKTLLALLEKEKEQKNQGHDIGSFHLKEEDQREPLEKFENNKFKNILDVHNPAQKTVIAFLRIENLVHKLPKGQKEGKDALEKALIKNTDSLEKSLLDVQKKLQNLEKRMAHIKHLKSAFPQIRTGLEPYETAIKKKGVKSAEKMIEGVTQKVLKDKKTEDKKENPTETKPTSKKSTTPPLSSFNKNGYCA
ncbi:MAG: hypothetical protein EOM53_03185 [Alphaproteobacteria bacterium]|nr:hypothetical protein [Alphaproteobacteria bacterium]